MFKINLPMMISTRPLSHIHTLVLIFGLTGISGCQSTTYETNKESNQVASWLTLRTPGKPPTPMMHGFKFEPPGADSPHAAGAYIQSSSKERGAKLYHAYCEGCHGVDARGDGVNAKYLAKKPADLRAKSEHFSKNRFFMMIAYGKGEMPSWRSIFTNEELRDLADYIKSLH